MDRKLLDSEWVILKALWGREPQAMHEIIESIQKEQPDVGWSYKTYHSYLRIMLEKGLIGCKVLSARDKLYFAAITQEEALNMESESLLSRISQGSVGRLMAMMAQKGRFSEKDKQELSDLISRLDNGEGEPK